MKRLLTLALLVALLAIGNTAAAGALGVNMGEPIKPNDRGEDKGWDAREFGVEYRPYKGDLPISVIRIRGTRKGGACSVRCSFIPIQSSYPDRDLMNRLKTKYGQPVLLDEDSTGVRKAVWYLIQSPHKVATIIASYYEDRLEYRFENYHECENAERAAKKAEEAAEKAKSKRKDAEL